MIISVAGKKKKTDKIQCPFTIKPFRNPETDEKLLTLLKGIYKTPVAYPIRNSQRPNAFSSAAGGPLDLCLASTELRQKGPWTPSSSLPPPCNLSSSPNLGNHLLGHPLAPGPANTVFCAELLRVDQPRVPRLVRTTPPGGGHPAVHRRVNTLPALPHPPLSGLLFPPPGRGSAGRPASPALARRSQSTSLEDAKPARRPASSRTCRSRSRLNPAASSPGRHASRQPPGADPEPGSSSARPGSARAGAHLSGFRQNGAWVRG